MRIIGSKTATIFVAEEQKNKNPEEVQEIVKKSVRYERIGSAQARSRTAQKPNQGWYFSSSINFCRTSWYSILRARALVVGYFGISLLIWNNARSKSYCRDRWTLIYIEKAIFDSSSSFIFQLDNFLNRWVWAKIRIMQKISSAMNGYFSSLLIWASSILKYVLVCVPSHTFKEHVHFWSLSLGPNFIALITRASSAELSMLLRCSHTLSAGVPSHPLQSGAIFLKIYSVIGNSRIWGRDRHMLQKSVNIHNKCIGKLIQFWEIIILREKTENFIILLSKNGWMFLNMKIEFAMKGV